MLSTLLMSIPQPPVNGHAPHASETVFDIFIFIPLAIALIVAALQIRGSKGPVLLYCIIGGAFAATLEPVVDVLGLVFLKQHGAVETFTVLGRTMPLYICFVYPWYVGGLGYLAYKLFQNGITMRGLFQLWALDFVIDFFLETPGILAKTYSYYGHQPFKILGFPLWWGFVNPVMPMVAGAMIYKILPRLRGIQLLAIIPLIPMADGLANGATAWPMWVVLNQQDVSYVWTYLASLITLGLALYSVWMISLIVARPVEEVGDDSIFVKLKAVFVRPTAIAPAVPAEPLTLTY
ncbi:MAG TPA: hypothetical protein VHW74_09080 [Mycobacteriales bacterium]|jgi:hypothetical protein|nr:hypothetical protein [Mycobacteriales bacterium]